MKAKSPENVATRFTYLKSLMEKRDINDASRIFNLDEFGFSLRGMTLGMSKCVVASVTRENTREQKFRVSCDHVIIMPVMFTVGQVLTPLVVLSGFEARWRKQSDGKLESLADFLLQPNYLNIMLLRMWILTFSLLGRQTLFRRLFF